MIIDTTLREGEQRFGVYFSATARKMIFSLLVDLGVEEIEVGWISPDPELKRFFTWASKRSGESKLSLWCPARKSDLEIARTLSPDRINLGLPISRGCHQDKSKVMKHVAAVLDDAARLGLNYISVGLENAFEEQDRALGAAEIALSHGAARIRLSDTPGRSTPVQVMETVTEFLKRFDVPLAVHCHNDLGMATANTICALAQGADYADVSILGLGERAGIAATHQVVAHLCLANSQSPYRMDVLPGLCRLVASEAGETIGRSEPVVGEAIFHCESGLHVDGLGRDPDLFFPFSPERVGSDIKIGLGKKSGRAAIAAACASRGFDIPEAKVDRLTRAVRTFSTKRQRPLTENEFKRLYRRSTAPYAI